MKYLEEHDAVLISKNDIEDMYNQNIEDSKKITFRLWWASALVLLFVVLVTCLSYRILNPLIGVAGVISPKGDVTQLSPNNNVDITGEAAYKFAKEAAIELNTYFFINYSEKLQSDEILFTSEGYDLYLGSTFESGLYTNVISNLLNVTSSISSKHFINAADFFRSGEHIWIVHVSLNLRTETKSGVDLLSDKRIVITMKEVDRNLSNKGLLIMEIIEL